ncbi:GatB/YqeY domain-containing protein [Candidatus Berkelbacteria bacterium]|nr:GatB/YqeY domain-containing protein [Candidatus Berkelbacteria bacterium]
MVSQINSDAKEALKAGRPELLSTLRMVKSALKNKQIELGHELNNVEALAVLQKEAKQRREAQAEYQKGNRPELAEKEGSELAILNAYLPTELSDEELTRLISETIQATGARSAAELGKVMSALMPRLQGRAGGSRVSAMVRKHLS